MRDEIAEILELEPSAEWMGIRDPIAMLKEAVKNGQAIPIADHWGGFKGRKHTEESKRLMGDSHRGIARSNETKNKISETKRQRYGYKGPAKPKYDHDRSISRKMFFQTEEGVALRKKQSELMKGCKSINQSGDSTRGKTWWTDGSVNKRSVECPGENYHKGRSKFYWKTRKK